MVGILAELLHLGYANGMLSDFSKDNNSITSNLMNTFTETLSPKDPNFAVWYKEYEARFNQKPDGQEPFDD